MSAMWFGPGGGLQEITVRCVHCRWGGGAEHGKTHVFFIPSLYAIGVYGSQCVTDDFGNLVSVQ